MSSLMNSADEPLDAADIALVEAIRDLYDEVDPVPAELATEIKFALSVQALHAEVAELQRAGTDAYEFAGAFREDDFARTETMTFTCDQFSAMITITTLDPEAVRIDGWLTVPGCSVELRVRPSNASGPVVSRVDADSDGRFTVARADKGLAQLVFRDSGRRPVITPYVEL